MLYCYSGQSDLVYPPNSYFKMDFFRKHSKIIMGFVALTFAAPFIVGMAKKGLELVAAMS